MDTGYYWDNSGHRTDGMTLNDTIVMDIFWLWTTLNEYWLWTRYNETIVLDIGHESYGMPPLAWILIMDHLLVMDHIECYRDNSGHRPNGMTLNDTIVMDTSYGSYGMITAINNYWLWTIWNASSV